jgi:hypothetical protein
VFFLGDFGDERPLEDQVVVRQGDALGDQVMPEGNFADVEIE